MKAKLFIALCLIITLGACNSEKDPVDIEEPTYNLDNIQITLDKTTVLENEELTFDIEGQGDFLTFFSGEEGNIYQGSANSGIKHTGRIDYYTYSFKEVGTYNVHFVFATKEGKERVFGPYEITVEVDPNKPKPLVEKTITIGLGPASPNVGESHLVDLAEIVGYSRAAVNTSELRKQIDIIVAWNAYNATQWGEPIFFDIAQIGQATPYYGIGMVTALNSWNSTDKNAGQFIRLSHLLTTDELAEFDELETIDDLVAHYTSLQSSISTRPNPNPNPNPGAPYTYSYNINWNGPGNLVNMADVRAGRGSADQVIAAQQAIKLQQLKDHVCIIYFKSSTRNLYAAIKMTISHFPTTFANPVVGSETTTGINAELKLEVKSLLVEP